MAKLRMAGILIVCVMLLTMIAPQLAVAAYSPTDKPVNVIPYDGATEITPSHGFAADWGSLDPEIAYRLQWKVIEAGGDWDHPLWDSGATTDNFTLPEEGILDYGRTYSWRLRFQDFEGYWSGWSDPTSFTVITNTPPCQPQNYEPDKGAFVSSLTPTLQASPFRDANCSWKVLDEADTQAASQWQVRTSSGSYSNPAIGGSYKASTIAFVAAARKIGDSAGGLAVFKPGDKILIGGSAKNDGIYTVSQSGASEIIVSEVLKDEAAGASVSMDSVQPGVSTSLTVPAGRLAVSTQYFWHVRYQDSYGNWSAYSAETSFRIIAAETGTTVASPEASFVADETEVVAGADIVTFTDTSTGSITSWVWDFGDGETENWTAANMPMDRQVTHVYEEKATDGEPYTVKLTVVNEAGPNTATRENYIVVSERPQAVFTGPASVKAGEEVTFTDASLGDNITSWVWNFGDGTAAVEWKSRQAGGKIVHKFEKAGSYAVSLTVSSPLLNAGNTSSKTTAVTGAEGFHFELWMILVGVAVVAVLAGIIYLVQARRAKK